MATLVTRRRPSRPLLLLCVAAGLAAYAATSSPLPTPERDVPAPAAPAAVAPAEAVARFSLPELPTLTESVDRPLFYANRRPPTPDPVAVPAAAPIQRGDFSLVGVSIRRDRREALIRRNSTKALAWVAEGDKLDEWKVTSVQPDRIVLEQGAEREVVELGTAEDRPPSSAPGQRAPAGAAAPARPAAGLPAAPPRPSRQEPRPPPR
jgi:hypothetical protein